MDIGELIAFYSGLILANIWLNSLISEMNNKTIKDLFCMAKIVFWISFSTSIFIINKVF